MFNTCIVPGCHEEDLSDLDQTTGLCGGCARSGAPALAGEVQRLTAGLEEARLTLAAEQGRAEGAPSEGWQFDGRDWSKNYADGSFAGLSGRRGKRRWMRALWPDTTRAPNYLGRGHDVETDRAAMKCADAAHPSTPAPAPE